MSNAAFKAKLSKLESLRSASDDDLLTGLRKALMDRNSYLIAKAASIAADRYAIAVIPELLRTYDRLFDPAPTVDPLGDAKTAIAKALKNLDWREPAVFLRGLGHLQLQAAWGEPIDVAAELRGTCALALVGCDIEDSVVLRELVNHLATDAQKNVRLDVVRAIAQVGGSQGMLLLRLKALCGDAEEEVVGECFVSLMQCEPRESLSFVERFLEHRRYEIRFEAVCALAGSREIEAQRLVARFWITPCPLDMRRAIIFSCAASAATQAAEFLLSIVSDPRPQLAGWALSALASSRFRDDLAERARQAADATGNAEVVAAYAAAFKQRPDSGGNARR